MMRFGLTCFFIVATTGCPTTPDEPDDKRDGEGKALFAPCASDDECASANCAPGIALTGDLGFDNEPRCLPTQAGASCDTGCADPLLRCGFNAGRCVPSTCDDRCAANESCVGDFDWGVTCVPIGDEGSLCLSFSEGFFEARVPCSDGLKCARTGGVNNQRGFCVIPQPVGGPCEPSPGNGASGCLDGLVCEATTATCATSCVDDACEGGLVCSGAGIEDASESPCGGCVAAAGEGELCDYQLQGVDGEFCFGTRRPCADGLVCTDPGSDDDEGAFCALP